METATQAWIAAAGLAVLFVVARLTVRFTVVYRRNNLAAGLAFALFAVSAYLWGWLGFAVFTVGTLAGAWHWVASIRRANEHMARERPAVLVRSRRRRASLSAH
jgi:Mn2+/Fe2+ NRAMP family transporter